MCLEVPAAAEPSAEHEAEAQLEVGQRESAEARIHFSLEFEFQEFSLEAALELVLDAMSRWSREGSQAIDEVAEALPRSVLEAELARRSDLELAEAEAERRREEAEAEAEEAEEAEAEEAEADLVSLPEDVKI